MDKTNFDAFPAEAIEYISKLESQIARLEATCQLLQKALYGRSSEKARYILNDGIEQLSVFNEAEAAADEAAPEPVEETVVVARARKPKRTKEELAASLPVKEVVIELPEDQRSCGICEGELRPIGKELVRREVTVIPKQTFVTETYRINYACGDCDDETDQANIVKTPVPEPVIKRGLASASSIAYVLYQKYVNHMPLNRLEEDWKNSGVAISRATLANWVIYVCSRWLSPLYKSLKAVLLRSPVVHADESVVQVLKEPGKLPQSESRMWVYCTGNTGGPPVILYEYQPGRSGDYAQAFLAGFSGFLQTDGYSGYNKVPDVTHCGCLAHLRRKFNDAIPKTAKKDSRATEGLEFCQKLFKLEAEFKALSPEDRKISRLEHSQPVLDAFFTWVATVNPLAGSKLAEAITYARNQRGPLSTFLLDGRVEISNNRCENAVRPFAVGRKNWLFSDTVRGARSSATAFSIVETAKANGLNPYEYLLYLFTELPSVLTKDPAADLYAFFPWSDKLPTACHRG